MTDFRSGTVPPPPTVPATHVNGRDGHRSTESSTASEVPRPPSVVRQVAAPRRWTAKGLAAAVICVLLGGLILMYAVPAYSHRHSVLVIARAVPVGASITDADLATADINSDPALDPIASDARDSVIGKVATTQLVPGTLVTRAELTTRNGFISGQVQVPLALKPGQFPAHGLDTGSAVLIVATPTVQDGGSTSTNKDTSDAVFARGVRAVVADVAARDPASSDTVVDVRVDQTDGIALARLAATGELALLLLPPGR